jgi:hypothetical protein
MVELIDKAERAAAQQGAVLVRKAAAVAALDEDRAAVRAFEEAGDVQHRRFAGARGADQRDDLAGSEREVDAVEHRELDPALAKHLADRAQFERRRRRCGLGQRAQLFSSPPRKRGSRERAGTDTPGFPLSRE